MVVDVNDLEKAWSALGKGATTADAASRLSMTAAELDRALWAWRSARTGSTEAQQRDPEHLARLRRLAPFDPMAAKALAYVEGRDTTPQERAA